MSTQVAVRLSDDLISAIDADIAAGRATSRADVVARAVRREARRLRAEEDARILAASTEADDLGELALWAQDQPLDLD